MVSRRMKRDQGARPVRDRGTDARERALEPEDRALTAHFTLGRAIRVSCCLSFGELANCYSKRIVA